MIKLRIEGNELTLTGGTPELQKTVTLKIAESKSVDIKPGSLQEGTLVMPIRIQEEAVGDMGINNDFAKDLVSQFAEDPLFLDFNEIEGKIDKFTPLHVSDISDVPARIASVKKPAKAPSGGSSASMNRFADLTNLTNSLGRLNVIEFPEIVRIARELMGTYPEVRKPAMRKMGRPLG